MTAPLLLDGIAKHPNPRVALHALNPLAGYKSQAFKTFGAGSGSPWLDFILRMGASTLLPLKQNTSFPTANVPLRADIVKHTGPYYGGRNSMLDVLANQNAPGMLAAMSRQSPSLSSYADAAGNAARSIPEFAPVVPYL